MPNDECCQVPGGNVSLGVFVRSQVVSVGHSLVHCAFHPSHSALRSVCVAARNLVVPREAIVGSIH